MAEVKWIKLSTDIFNDEKILLIEDIPESDTIIVIWLKMLCLCGRINNDGILNVTDKVPYTEKMLATIFRKSEKSVHLAIETFKKFGMVEIIDNTVTIPNWSKHQSIDKMNDIREYNRLKQRESRQRKRLLIEKNPNVNDKSMTVNENVNTDIDIEVDKEEEKEKDKRIQKKKNGRHKHGEYNHVLLSDEELEKLNRDYGSTLTSQAITYLDEYCEMKGKAYKNCYLTLKKWVFDAVNEKAKRSFSRVKQPETSNPFLRMLWEEEAKEKKNG